MTSSGPQSWEMTQQDWLMNQSKDFSEALRRTGKNALANRAAQGKVGWDRLNEWKNTHRQQVEQALLEGKPVPPEVLAQYPDLAMQDCFEEGG